MKHLLLDVPHTTLGLILSFEGVFHCPILLWLCGSKHLQQKLTHSVQILKLENLNEDPIAVPKIVPSFLALRELIIERGDLMLKESDDCFYAVQRLPKSLERLVFRAKNWQKFLLEKPVPQSIDSSLNTLKPPIRPS